MDQSPEPRIKQVEAKNLGLEVQLITDSGRTEFHGQPPLTCLAIGPDDAFIIDEVTEHLELLCWAGGDRNRFFPSLCLSSKH